MVKMKLGEGNIIFPIKHTFIYINFIPLLFMINERVLTEYFLFVELGQVIAITILIILAIIGYIQIKKEK